MMKLAIMQPYIFPYIGYFQLLNCVDKFVIYDDVNYINRGWINRNKILLQGTEHQITFPLTSASQNKLICEISLHKEEKWRKKLQKTIGMAYSKAPYFNNVKGLVDQVLFYEESNLSKYAFHSIKLVQEYLGIDCILEESSTVYQNKHLTKQTRIKDICLQESASAYYNPVGGIELYDKDFFGSSNISLFFIETKNVSYPQFSNKFVPNLSIIDVMMFNSISKIREFLKNNYYSLYE